MLDCTYSGFDFPSVFRIGYLTNVDLAPAGALWNLNTTPGYAYLF